MKIKDLFAIEERPRKGLLAFEWVILAYTVITLLIVLFCFTKVANPGEMVWGRVRIAAITFGLWAVYRFMPCKATEFLRALIEFLLLAWWYQDTANINILFPNLDHIVAYWDQMLFGFQPALVFAEKFTQPVLSEFLEISYAMYYPIILVVCVYYFWNRYQEFEKCCFIVAASFFTYYLIFDFIPVAGPMYYYPAIGMENVVKGVFPVLTDKISHTSLMKAPGWIDGIGYQLIVDIHGDERPTGAFPSSHVGITIVSLLLAIRSRSKKLTLFVLPFCIGICFATVYIRSHYAMDAIIGFVSGIVLYFFWNWVANRWKFQTS